MKVDGDIDVLSHNISNVLDPVNAQDAATKGFTEALVNNLISNLAVELTLTVQQRLSFGETPKHIFDIGIIIDSFYGKTYKGGLIFYLNTTTGTGFVAAPIDISPDQVWGCDGLDLPNVPNVIINPPTGPGAEIGNGSTNTTAILSIGNCPTAPAALACTNYMVGGFDDWFLPSIIELGEMYNIIGPGATGSNQNIGGFSSNFYWSSTEGDDDNAWTQEFTIGYPSYANKNASTGVRAVRAF